MDKPTIRHFFDEVLEASKTSPELLKRIEADILEADDGFYVYWPTSRTGFLDEYHLVLIAAMLNKKNREWDDIIDNDVGIGL